MIHIAWKGFTYENHLSVSNYYMYNVEIIISCDFWKVDKAKENVRKIGEIVEGVEAAANRTMTAESRLNNKLKMLRDNIKQARAQAEKVSDFESGFNTSQAYQFGLI